MNSYYLCACSYLLMATIQIRCTVPVHLIVSKRQLDSAEAKAFSVYYRRVLLKLADSRTA